METITQVISRMKKEEMQEEEKPSPSCKISWQKDEQCLTVDGNDSVVTQNRDYKRFLIENSPDKQHAICHDVDNCYFGDSPTLSELGKIYGSGLPKAWLIPQLANLCEYCGLKQDASSLQLKELAIIIYNKYYWLKVDELLLFFYRFKCNCYRHFYCYFDPMAVMESLRLFTDERYQAHIKREQKERERQKEIDGKNAISYEEYMKINGQKIFK